MWLFPAFQLQPKQHLYQLSKHKSVKPWCVYLHAKKESINVNVCIHVSLDGPPPTETCQVNIWGVGVLGGGEVSSVQRGHMPSEAIHPLHAGI